MKLQEMVSVAHLYSCEQLGVATSCSDIVFLYTRSIASSGGFRNLERGVQPLAREMRPKIWCCHTHYRSRECIHDTCLTIMSFEVPRWLNCVALETKMMIGTNPKLRKLLLLAAKGPPISAIGYLMCSTGWLCSWAVVVHWTAALLESISWLGKPYTPHCAYSRAHASILQAYTHSHTHRHILHTCTMHMDTHCINTQLDMYTPVAYEPLKAAKEH